MFYLRLIATSFRSLDAHFLRSLLATVGVLIGVSSVVACMSIIEGTKNSITSQFKSLGSNVIYVGPQQVKIEGRPVGFAQTLLPANVRALQHELDQSIGRIAASALAQAVTVKYFQKSEDFSLLATNADYFEICAFNAETGRIFTNAEAADETQAVCLLGAKVSEKLFAGIEPMGQLVKIGSGTYRVIGVMERRGSMGFIDADQTIYIPLEPGLKRFFNRKWLSGLTIEAADSSKMDETKKAITRVLRNEHKITSGETEDFWISNQQEALDNVNQIMMVFQFVFYTIAGISLIVGGIGIMNIMLVSVTERTREIGVRMAVGARRMDILLQFLVEALVISLIGGALGLLLGTGMSDLFGNLLKAFRMKVEINPLIVMVAVLSATIVGVVSGIYPAWRASRLDPVEALRFE